MNDVQTSASTAKGQRQVVKVCLAAHYFGMLKELGKQLGSEYMRTPYVLTCAATLEYLLNDLIACYALHSYRDEDMAEIAESLYTLSLSGKLKCLPGIVTAGRLVINRNSASYSALSDLIKSRNTLVHNKPFTGMVEFEDIEGGMSFRPPGKMFLNYQLLFDETRCKRFRLALIEFTKQIHSGDPAMNFNPDALQPSDLLKLAQGVPQSG